MARKRTEQLVARVEPIIRNALDQHLTKTGVSASDYIRKLVIDDLRKKGVLPDSLLAELLIC